MKTSNRIILSLSVILLMACPSVSNTEETPGTDNPIENDWSEEEYPQVVLLEKFTGTWCGYCPDGERVITGINEDYDNLHVLSYHVSDSFSCAESSSVLDDIRDYTGVPSALIQRSPISYLDTLTMGRGYWPYAVGQAQEATVPVGIALDTEINGTNGTVSVDIHHSPSYESTVYLTVIVSEDGLLADQSNYYNDDADSPFYGLGHPIVDYELNHVVRDFLTGPLGDTLSVGGQIESQSYTFSLDDDWVSSNLVVTAFVHYGGAGDQSILNVRYTDLGSSVSER